MKDLITMFNNAINNNRDTLEKYWQEYISTADIDELFNTYKEIHENLPTGDYVLSDMLVDRERYSTLPGTQYIEDLLDEADVDKVSELPEDYQLKVMTVFRSGYGSFTIDW